MSEHIGSYQWPGAMILYAYGRKCHAHARYHNINYYATAVKVTNYDKFGCPDNYSSTIPGYYVSNSQHPSSGPVSSNLKEVKGS